MRLLLLLLMLCTCVVVAASWRSTSACERWLRPQRQRQSDSSSSTSTSSIAATAATGRATLNDCAHVCCRVCRHSMSSHLTRTDNNARRRRRAVDADDTVDAWSRP